MLLSAFKISGVGGGRTVGLPLDWNNLLHTLSIVLAIAGGIFSLAGWWVRKREPEGEPNPRAWSHILTIVAYILMSLSIFLFALRGLLFST